jgi:hypothetical protein
MMAGDELKANFRLPRENSCTRAGIAERFCSTNPQMFSKVSMMADY